MSAPSPFLIGREAGSNLSNAFARVKDENAIETILSEAMGTGNPEVLQNSIGKILSQVSPERQGQAVQYLQNTYANLQKKQDEARRVQSAEKGGYDPYAPPQVQAAQVREGAKGKRINEAENVFSRQGGGQNVPNLSNQESSNVPQEVSPPILNEKQRKQELLRLTGHPDIEIRNRAKAELDMIESAEKEEKADIRALRKETLPLKQKIIERADASRESIRNKNHLLEIIDRGNLDDPTFAIFATSLPLNLGKRMLSKDTVEYKGGLVDEFSDLKNIFKGATRVKEVELYEDKLADIYLTDSQKKAILKSRVNTAKIDLIREEAAAEVEQKYPNISALQFNKKVEELSQPKVNALFNSVWDEQKHVLDQAEKRKKVSLDINDPEDKDIIRQILKEANGNYIEAEKIAKKKGYKF